MSADDARAITELLFRYAELMDLGDFERAAALFADASVRVGPEPSDVIDARELQSLWERTVIRYDDGTPRTRHVVTNPMVELAVDGTSATARSVYTVFQQTTGGTLQPIVSGRYHDRFVKADGTWRFSERDYTLVDLVGDTTGHLRLDLRERRR